MRVLLIIPFVICILFAEKERKKDKFVLFSYQKRWKEHLDEAKNPDLMCQSRLLNESIRKYGVDCFTIDLICVCEVNDLDNLESQYVLEYNSLAPFGYNLTSGGRFQMTVAPEVRKRLSESGKAYFSKEGNKEKQSSIISDFYYDDIINRYSSMDIDLIEIRPINENGSFNIIYMYIYSKNEQNRIRLGGKHISFDDTFEKAKKIALELLDENHTKLNISPLITNMGNEWAKYIKKANSLADLGITKVRFTIHKHTHNDVISTFIRTSSIKNWKDEIKIVFGGKTVSLEEAFQSAIAFYTLIDYDTKKIIFSNEKIKKLWRDFQIAGTP